MKPEFLNIKNYFWFDKKPSWGFHLPNPLFFLQVQFAFELQRLQIMPPTFTISPFSLVGGVQSVVFFHILTGNFKPLYSQLKWFFIFSL